MTKALRLPALLLAGALVAAGSARAEDPEPYIAGYSDRFLAVVSPEVAEKGTLEAMFLHRFNQPVNQAGGTDLFGLDSGANIGLGLSWVPLEGLSIEAFRASTLGDYEFSAKWAALRPTARLPLGVSLRAGANWMTKAKELDTNAGAFGQLLVAWTFDEKVTIAVAPSFTTNTVLFKNAFNVPIDVRVKLSKRLALVGEYVPRNGDLAGSVGQWSAGLETVLFRHRFTVTAGNSAALTVDQMVAGDYGGGVKESNVRLGFNIVRQFEIGN